MINYLQRFCVTNVKLVLIFLIVFLLLYMKFFQYAPMEIDQSWHSVNKFDDSLDQLRQNLQYAVMIDAGSSGSRVYIYVWPPHSGDTRQLLNIRMLHDKLGKDVYYAITPGLSSCSTNPSNSSEYLAPLLKFAADNIPKEKHKETPLYVLATAGMRLLDLATQNAILEDLRKDIPKEYSFLFTPSNVAVISGKEEGIYSWISINYLMGRFDHTLEKAPLITVEYDSKSWKRMNTISMIEMGGASVQIGFEITSNGQFNQLKARFPDDILKDSISEFNLGCSEHDTNHKYRLFVTTYLTLGANAARQNYISHLIKSSNQKFSNTSLFTKETVLLDPCLSIDSSETINMTHPNEFSKTQFLYHLKGTGDYTLCQRNLRNIILKSECHSNQTCPYEDLKNVVVPFKSSDFYGLSEFWYTMNDIYRMGGPYVYTKFAEASSKYCSTSWLVTQDRHKRKLYPNADFKRLLYQCFKSAWLSSVLHEGFKMPTDYTGFQSVNTLNGEPVQWTLGALIFRTRFFPLRSIDNQHGVMVQHVVNTSNANVYIQYMLFSLCMVAVIFFICIHLRRLHTMLNNSNGKPYYMADNIETHPLCHETSQDTRMPPEEHKIFIAFN